MGDNSFSFSDQLRPCLYTCFPCSNQPSSPSSPSDHFPDAVHRALLHEVDDHNQLPDYYLQSTSQLSRWDLLLSWLFSKTSDRLILESRDVDIQTSALPPTDEADALLLDDISIALQARSAHRKNSASPTKSHPHTSHQPQPMPFPSVTSVHKKKHRKSRDLNHHPPTHFKAAPQTSSSTHCKNSQNKEINLSRIRNLSSPSHQKSSKSRSKSSKQSSSVCTDEKVDTDPNSLPSLLTSRTTIASSSAPSSDPLKLNVEIIKFIHQNYNQESRKLYGRDLSRVQIQQLCEYLISRRFKDPVGLSPRQPGPFTANVEIDTSDQKLDEADSLAQGVHLSLTSRPKTEIESLKRIQLSSTEFLQAIKQTKTTQHQLALDPSNPQNSGISSPADDSFDIELQDDVVIPSFFLDWFSKGSQITSELFNSPSANQST